MIFIILLTIVLILVIAYSILVLQVHKLDLPNLDLNSLKDKSPKTNILFIFPHPDDEVMSSGGLIKKMILDKDFNVFVVSTTKGEHGDEVLKILPTELAEIRSEEFAKALNRLGVNRFEAWNYMDGGMPAQEVQYKNQIAEYIKLNNIQIVVTYEKYGMYGHPDHISLSKVVNQLQKELGFKVIYSTLPDKILKRLNLPKTLTYKDRVIDLSLDKISNPEFKVNTNLQILDRYLAAKEYKSQAFTKNPIEFIKQSLFRNFEYYTTKYSDSSDQNNGI